MSGGPPRRGPGRSSGRSTPSGGGGGPRRPGRGSSSDSVLPLITGVLGSSILAFSLYVLSHKPWIFGADQNQPTVVAPVSCEQPAASGTETCYYCEGEPCLSHGDPRIKLEKRKFLTYDEEATKERQDKTQYRSRLQKELKQHLRKVKELTDELERDEQANKRNWSRETWWSNDE